MKPKPPRQDYDRQHFSVNYQWSGSDGIICRSHSVGSGRNRSEAVRRFFNRNRNVRRDDDYAD